MASLWKTFKFNLLLQSSSYNIHRFDIGLDERMASHFCIYLKAAVTCPFCSPDDCTVSVSDVIRGENQTVNITESCKHTGQTHLVYQHHIQILTNKHEQKWHVVNKIITSLVSLQSHCRLVWSITTKGLDEPTARQYNKIMGSMATFLLGLTAALHLSRSDFSALDK